MSVDREIVERWYLVAVQLGESGAGLRLELDTFQAGDNTRDRLERVAKAARLAERCAASDLKDLADALATEIEIVVER